MIYVTALCCKDFCVEFEVGIGFFSSTNSVILYEQVSHVAKLHDA